MKNRKILLCLALLLSLAMATTGTIAYLQDTDSAVNVMTLGNVYIEQIEQERGEEGMKDFVQSKPLFPITGAEAGLDLVEDGEEGWLVWEENPNVVDKFITVENTGKSPAYVRTIVAIEDIENYIDDRDLIHYNANEGLVTASVYDLQVGDRIFDVLVFTYPEPLAAGDVTIPSLKQFYMDHLAGNEHMEALGDECEIVAVSQGLQVAGFDSAEGALNAGFGPADGSEEGKANLVEWISAALALNEEAHGLFNVYNARELARALSFEFDGVKIINVMDDITATDTMEAIGDLEINLNGFGLDASAAGSAFTVKTDANITFNGSDEEVKLGANGLVDVVAGADAVIEINGGNFVSDDASSTLIKPDGTGTIKIVLNNVNYKSTASVGYALDCSYYDGQNLSVEINGGSYEATIGLLLPAGSSVKGAKITAHNTKNMQPALYAMGDMTVEGCVIKADKSHAVAVAGGATLNVNNCEVYAGTDADAMAFQVFSSGGTINVTGGTYEGLIGTTGKVSTPAIINIDGVEQYRKNP